MQIGPAGFEEKRRETGSQPRDAFMRIFRDPRIARNNDPVAFLGKRVDPHDVIGVRLESISEMSNFMTVGSAERVKCFSERGREGIV